MPTVIISANTSGADYGGVEDARIRRAVPTTNDGSGATLEATAYDVGDDNRSLIRFTGLSNIASNAVVSDASLILNISSRIGDFDIDIYRCTRAWVQSQATFNNFATGGGNVWATAGGLGTGDVSGSPIYTGTPTTGTGDRTFTSAGIISAVQGWIAGSFANDGFLLHHTSDPAASLLTRVYEFVSSEGTDGLRPRLYVTFTVPAGGRSLSLLGVG